MDWTLVAAMLCCVWTSHSVSPPLGNCAKFWPIWQNGRAAADNSTEYSADRSRCSAALERASGEPVRHFGCIGLGSSGAAGYRVATLAAEGRGGRGRRSGHSVWANRGQETGQENGTRNGARNGQS